MSKLALPSRAYIEDFVTRAFPQYDWSRGSAINDLVIKAFSAIIQPLRHEIDAVKVNGSVSNWQYMRAADLDALAANWGKFRQTGGLSIGTVRIYFSAAQDYQFNTLEFFSSDGTTFVLSNPVSIIATDLFTRRLSDGTFYFDVTVQSVGAGSRYALPSNSITGVRNKPVGIISVANLSDFHVTAPDESNFDVVNSMYKNLGMRNLVSRQSIRAPILDNFPGIVDVFIAGVGHPQMLRDLITVQLPTGAVQMHLGGMTDVWLNTTSISKQQVLISYVPTSLEIKIVSANQAQSSELIFSFTRGQYSIDGVYSNPDVSLLALDESTSVQFDVQGVPESALVLGLIGANQAQLAARDILAGTELISLVGPSGFSPYFGDLTNLNFNNTDVQANDYVLVDGVYRKVIKKSGRLLDLAPLITSVQTYAFSGTPLAPSVRAVPLPSIDIAARINDRLILPNSAAAGEYTILGLAANVAYIGKPVAKGTAVSFGASGTIVNGQVFRYFDPLGGRPLLPPGVGTTHFLYFGTDAGYDQTKYFQIASIIPGLAYTTITVIDPAAVSPTFGTPCSVIQGLAGILPSPSLFTLQRDQGALSAQDSVQSFAVGHTKYANATPVAIPAGTNVLVSLGIGAVAAVGDLIEFTDVNVATALIPQTGGDGSRVSVIISSITSTDQVSYTPPLPFNVAANTAFSVQRNATQVAQAVATVVDSLNSDFTVASMPLGLGDALGLIVKDPSDNQYIITSATAGNVRTLQFNAPVGVRTLTFTAGGYVPPVTSDTNKAVQQIVGATTYNGVLFDFDNSTRTWRVIPNTSSDLFSDVSAINVLVVGGSAKGRLSIAASAIALAGYVDAVVADLGSLVRQGVYTGLLDAYDNTIHAWKVKPLSDSDLFDSTTVSTFVDIGSGTPTPAHGAGTLVAPAGPVTIGTGAVTLSLSAPPGFGAGAILRFFSRLGRSGGLYNGSSFLVSKDPLINTAPFAGVIAGSHDLMILAGNNAGIYPITKVNPFNLLVTGSLTPEYVKIPNCPTAQPIVNATAWTVGTTTFAQPNIGLWASPGRAIRVTGSGGTFLFVVASINNINSVEIENPGLTFTLFPNSGFTYQIVEALNTPFWIVPAANLKKYRIFRVADHGDLIEASSLGGFSNVAPTSFTDNTVDFASLLVNADFVTTDYQLFIDSGSQASSTPVQILNVASTNVITVAVTFTLTESNVAYRIVRFNKSRDTENWVEATVVAMADPKTQLLLNVPNGYDFARYGSRLLFDVTIVPHPSWVPPGGWGFGTNWQMPKFTAAYDPGTKILTLDTVTNHWTYTAGDAYTALAGMLLVAGSKVRVSLRIQDRSTASQLSGSALNTFNYYADTFFNLPVVQISDVQLLDSSSLQPVRSVDFSLRVDNPGLRYSAQETNTLVINDPTVALLPLAITYVADSSVVLVNNYLNQADTRVVNANQLAKRMETFSVSVTISVRSTLTANEVSSQIASFINTRRSTQVLSKADIIKDLYSNTAISYIDIGSFVMTGKYYKQNGTTELHTAVDEVFGAETATYLANNISVIIL